MLDFSKRKLSPTKTLGERLKILRKRRHLSLDQVEEATKVRLRYLEALERGNYAALPANVYVYGFLGKYAELLNVPKEELISAFHGERGDAYTREIAPAGAIKERRAYLTPKMMIWGALSLVLVCFSVYIFYAVSHFTSAPNLEILAPSTETVIREDRVEVIGKTDQGVSMEINDQIVYLDDRGNFKETVKLVPGLNTIELKAVNRIKKQTVKVVKVLAEYQ